MSLSETASFRHWLDQVCREANPIGYIKFVASIFPLLQVLCYFLQYLSTICRYLRVSGSLSSSCCNMNWVQSRHVLMFYNKSLVKLNWGGLLLLLQIYAGSFFAIPLIRWFILRQRNAGIEKRNLARVGAAKALQLPDISLRRKVINSSLFFSCLLVTDLVFEWYIYIISC